MTLAVEVEDSGKHVAVKTGEGQQVSQGLVEQPLGRGIKGDLGEIVDRDWTQIDQRVLGIQISEDSTA